MKTLHLICELYLRVTDKESVGDISLSEIQSHKTLKELWSEVEHASGKQFESNISKCVKWYFHQDLDEYERMITQFIRVDLKLDKLSE